LLKWAASLKINQKMMTQRCTSILCPKVSKGMILNFSRVLLFTKAQSDAWLFFLKLIRLCQALSTNQWKCLWSINQMESTPSRENLRTMTHSFMRSIQTNQATDFTLQVKTEKSFILMEKETLQSNLMAMKIVLIVFLSQFQKSLWLDHGTEQPEFGTPKQVNAFTFWRVISMLFQSWVFQTEL